MIISITDESLKTLLLGALMCSTIVGFMLSMAYFRYKEKRRSSEDEADRKQLMGYSIPTKKVVTHGTGKEVTVLDQDYYSNG